MQFSESWLRSLVNPALDTRQLGHLLTMAGLEVEAMEPVAGAFTNVVVAEILSAEKHPNADRLQVCQVNTGGDAPLTIVCGAPNARAGLKTACALVGAELPGNFQIKQAKVRGVESFGMLCSAKELGIVEAADGILELAADALVGQSIRQYLDLDDTRITLKLTPNRGDCLSVMGIARETAALTASPLEYIDCSAVGVSVTDTHPVQIEAEAACPRYCGRVIRGIDPAARTPAWMARRLERSGLRPIHPVVDVTNYLLLELGQPMHGFDLARLQGPICARMARSGEKLELLNGQTLELQPDSLVIADDSGPLALAGIMGGQGSGVTADTCDVFLEAAHFAPEAIAGRARAYGLSTDSSHRFERGVDPQLPAFAIERATRLILDICGGQAGPVISVGPGVAPAAAIPFRPARARRILGFDLADDAMADILRRLGMNVEAAGEGFLALAPSHRFDLTREVDLIEEIARVHGYDNLPAAALRGEHAMLPAAEGARPAIELKKLMAARGNQEIITYSFISAELDADFRADGQTLPLLNPIASQMGVMRGSLLGGLIQTLRHNLNHGQERLKVFEVGRAFISDQSADQPLRLAALRHGAAAPEQWGEAARGVDFFDLRADLEALFGAQAVNFRPEIHPALHPGQCARVLLGETPVGWIGTLHPRLTQKYGFIKAPVLCEIALDALTHGLAPRYSAVARLPAVRRDLAVVVDNAIAAGDMLAAVNAARPSLVADFALFDLYQGKGVDEGKKSLAFKVLLQHTEKTLTDSEIDETVQSVLAILNKNFNASLRG
ncbi:MAG: phenylalanine--tRNA ligase subunit beta [Betaproteobacteria bacterium]|nr:phenylalanine--tRNA ligase subunit beta [Betaproteobacteria bacterium]